MRLFKSARMPVERIVLIVDYDLVAQVIATKARNREKMRSTPLPDEGVIA